MTWSAGVETVGSVVSSTFPVLDRIERSDRKVHERTDRRTDLGCDSLSVGISTASCQTTSGVCPDYPSAHGMLESLAIPQTVL